MRTSVAARVTGIAGALAVFFLAAGVEGQQPVQDPGPNRTHQSNASYDWAWGELVYGRTYTTVLTITNKCRMARVVHFFISDPFFEKRTTKNGERVTVFEWLRPPIVNGRAQREVQAGDKMPVSARAMLGIPAAGCVPIPFGGGGSGSPGTCQMVVPPGVTPVDVTIRTAPPPDLSGVIMPPGFDPSTLYDEVAGELVAYHAGNPPACLASREEYIPSGHVHLDPDPPKPGGGGGPRCRDWWDTEKKPQGLTDDCTDEIRDLALAYRRAVLAPLIAQDPNAWDWVPTEDEIRTMTAEQLIAMKARARARIRN
jgi:hypothetical protein